MENLMLLNWGELKRDFVAGKEEIELFKQKEYARLHASTVSKVRLFSEIVERILDHKLKTEQATFYIRMEQSLEHPYAKVVALLAALWTIVSISLLIWK